MVKAFAVLCPPICCGFIIFVICAVALSFKSLEQGRFALNLGWYSQAVSEEVFNTPGLRMVSMGNSLIEYPSTFQYIYFTSGDWNRSEGDADEAEALGEIRRPHINARTQDGLNVQVELSFQWKLNPSALIALHGILRDTTYADNYRYTFVRLARSSVIESCANFTADKYFTNRTYIKTAILEHLVKMFKQPENGLSVTIQGAQLQQVLLPPEYNEEIVLTTEQKQAVEVATAERVRETTKRQTAMLVERQAVEIAVLNARASRNATLRLNQAEVDQIRIYQSEQALANAQILQAFINDGSPFDRLFGIMEVRAMTAHSQDRVIFNFASAR